MSRIRRDQLQKNKWSKNAGTIVDAVLRSKFCVFWQALQEIADQELKSEVSASQEEENDLMNEMKNFPDKSKLPDGRMWLPLHFAMFLPNTDLVDIRTIIAAQPQAISIAGFLL